jgi:hypothetical protein
MTEAPRSFVLQVSGLEGVQIRGETRVEVPATATHAVTLQVVAPASAGRPGANTIYFEVEATDDPSVATREETTFLFPR